MNLFNLFAKLTLDTSDYEKKLKESQKSGSSFSSKFGVAMKTAGKAVLAVGAAVTATAAVVTKLVTGVTDLAGEIDDNAQRLGMSTDAYQKWQFALKLGGAEISTFQTSMRQLTEFTTQLSQGQGEALIALQKLGIGYEEFMALPVEDQLQAVIEGLQGMESQTDKTRLAQEIFGNRAYQDLMPILNMEKGSLDELFTSVEDLGLIMSEDAVQAGAALGDQMDIARQKFTMVKANIVSEFFPAIELLLDGFIELASGSKGASDKIADGFLQMQEKVLGLLSGLIENAPEIVSILTGLSFELGARLFDTLLNLDWGNLVISLLETVFNIVFVQLPNLIGNIGESLYAAMSNLFSAEGLANFGKFGIKLGETLINGIISAIEGGINLIVKGLNAILGIELFGERIGITIPEVSIPRVKFLAKGGMFDDLMNGLGTLYVGGEAGAEIAHTGSRGTGIANVEQIADAQYMAMQDYGLREEIARAAEVIVNGVVMGLRNNQGSNTRGTQTTIKIGDRTFKAYVFEATNQSLKSKGRKTLNTVTAY